MVFEKQTVTDKIQNFAGKIYQIVETIAVIWPK
jgi:hypothetical protein